ncbi:hypothetical protein [Flavobacterium sp. XGLA_31]|uniref:hypothetical protein n=1 Tax=Flavobacterium sp. XGLA_31 TaxID=3447666 RepID=UPI003F37EC3C
MKQLILITAFLMAMTTKLLAQNKNGIEVKSFTKQTNEFKAAEKENHQFEITAHEDVDVNLKFSLKTEGNVDIVVKDTKDKVVFTKKIKKSGDNRLAFSMEENEKYVVTLDGDKRAKLILQVSENQ